MNKYEIINKSIIILITVIAFIVTQTLFFIFIASKQEDNIISNKTEILTELSKKNSFVRQKLQSLLNSKDEILQKAAEEERLRWQQNLKTLKINIGIPVLVLSILLFGLIILKFVIRSPGDPIITISDVLGLIMIFLIYLPELYLYFIIIKQYQFIGDFNILTLLLR